MPFYSKNCIQPMYRCLEEGRLRIIDFFSDVKVKIVDEKEFAGLDASMLSLINLNTPEEYKNIVIATSEAKPQTDTCPRANGGNEFGTTDFTDCTDYMNWYFYLCNL